jgi:hypothetical protein
MHSYVWSRICSFDDPFAIHVMCACCTHSELLTTVTGSAVSGGAPITTNAPLNEANKALHHATQSMFSLRTNKSMRLQKYGAWIAYHDTQSDSVFWYNHETAQVRYCVGSCAV